MFKQIKMLKRTQLLKNNNKESEYRQPISRCFLCLHVLVQIKMSKNKCKQVYKKGYISI